MLQDEDVKMRQRSFPPFHGMLVAHDGREMAHGTEGVSHRRVGNNPCSY